MATLPKHDMCRRVMEMLKDEPTLNAFEYEFVKSNQDRETFTDKQREVVREMMLKYECS